MTDDTRETCGTCRHYDASPDCDPYRRCRYLRGCWTSVPGTPACACWERERDHFADAGKMVEDAQ